MTIVYTLVCILAFISFVVVTFIRPPGVRVPLMIVMLIAWGFELSILDLNGALSNQDLLWILWQERVRALEAIDGYAPYIIRDWALVGIVAIALCASPAWRFSIPGIFGLLPIVSGVLVTAVVAYTKGGTQIFPIPFGTFANAAIVLSKSSKIPSWGPGFLSDVVTPGTTKIEGSIHPIFNKIVMIMDESVRGDYVSLNDAARTTTPFLKVTDNLVNFGVAISGANCSDISRTIFRFGMQQSELPKGWRDGLSSRLFGSMLTGPDIRPCTSTRGITTRLRRLREP